MQSSDCHVLSKMCAFDKKKNMTYQVSTQTTSKNNSTKWSHQLYVSVDLPGSSLRSMGLPEPECFSEDLQNMVPCGDGDGWPSFSSYFIICRSSWLSLTWISLGLNGLFWKLQVFFWWASLVCAFNYFHLTGGGKAQEVINWVWGSSGWWQDW